MNAIDQAISHIAPGWALRRQRARHALAMHSAWSGASRTRPQLSGWDTWNSDADAELIYDLPTLRARSLDSYRNAPLAGGAIHVMDQSVIGTGLSLQPAIDAPALGWTDAQVRQWTDTVKRRWRQWAETTDCDLTRATHFYRLQSTAFKSMLLSGDVFVVLTAARTPDGRDVPALQLIEADRVSNPQGEMNSTSLVAGVALNARGQADAYWINRGHPGSITDTDQKYIWDRLPAWSPDGQRRVIHLFDRLRPGQTRGVPWLAPVLEHFKQLARYTEAELQAAVVSGAFAMFLQIDPQAFQDLFAENPDSIKQYIDRAISWDGSYPQSSLTGPGKAVNLLPGESVHDSNPGRPNDAFDPFVQAIIRQIGSRLGIPFEVMIHHYTSSYSASRAARLDAWSTFRVWRELVATQLCQPIYEYWLTWEVAQGRIEAPGFFADADLRRLYCEANWIGDGPGSINPKDDAAAAKLRVDMGISTLATESINHDGIEWEVKHAQRAKEVQARREAGLDEPLMPAEGLPAGQEAP